MDLLKLLLAALVAALLGANRSKNHKPAGIRTLVLVGVGACLASNGVAADKYSSAVISGVGFLGAGSILKDSPVSGGNGEKTVVGITTAALIWLVAISGLLIGQGKILPSLFAALIGYVALRWLPD